MKRSTYLMITFVYYISQVFGLVAFTYNYETGKLKTNIFVTLYSFAMTLLMFSSLFLIPRVQWKPRNGNGPQLHYKITALMCLFRMATVLITVAVSWYRKRDIMKFIRDFQKIRDTFSNKFTMSPKVQKYFERSIEKKFYWGFASNLVSFFSFYDVLKGIFDLESNWIVTGLGTLATVLNILMAHYFFGLLNINVLLAVLEEEVTKVLHTASVVFKLQHLKQIKQGKFITICCQLADEIDDLAEKQKRLQAFGERISQMFGLQGACCMLMIYMGNINVIYMSYILMQNEELSQDFGPLIVLIALPITLISYYMDLQIFVENMLDLVKYVENMSELLKNCQPCLPTLDERFEKSLKDFSIQLALFPLQMKLLGLFQFNRSMTFVTFGSTISNAIVLIQYDYKYNKN